jgi:glycosyltransferase involved in cell wall biosynthesis
MIKWFKKQKYDIHIIVLDKGDLINEFEKIGKVYYAKNNLVVTFVLAYLRAIGVNQIFCNTIVTGNVTRIAKLMGYHVITLIHELMSVVNRDNNLEKVTTLIRYSDKLIFSSNYAKKAYDRKFGLCQKKTYVIPQGVFVLNKHESNLDYLKSKLNIQSDSIVVIGAGSTEKRKGTDLFIEVANQLTKIDPRYIFIWIGKVTDQFSNYARQANCVKFVDFTQRIFDYYNLADLLLLTSREDPFPCVVQDIISYGKPVVAFKNAGGFCEIDKHFISLVDYLDCTEMANEVNKVIGDYSRRKYISENGNQYIKENYNFDNYMLKIYQLLK